MIIGVAKEIKNNENRVGLTPAGANALVKAGHKVLIEQSAGVGSGFEDGDYCDFKLKIGAEPLPYWPPVFSQENPYK